MKCAKYQGLRVFRQNNTKKRGDYVGFFGGGSFVGSTFNYDWVEEKTVLSGNNSFIISNTIPANSILRIVDKKYGQEWFEGIHFTRNGQVITLTETSLQEQITFQVYCFKNIN